MCVCMLVCVCPFVVEQMLSGPLRCTVERKNLMTVNIAYENNPYNSNSMDSGCAQLVYLDQYWFILLLLSELISSYSIIIIIRFTNNQSYITT